MWKSMAVASSICPLVCLPSPDAMGCGGFVDGMRIESRDGMRRRVGGGGIII
jgi:hypothetical protein